ncbi:MAG TPA: class I adenylate-forming enzyme family protein [Syntrophorhabdaceae bacterium]|nr:class I adenylate-forming enzyme family protein [Syntrophorhabdaceae bacterium]
MNFAMFSGLNASKFPKREFIIESYPSKGLRRSLTWEQFDDQANKLANYLMKECGVKKGDIVLHLMMNCMEWYASYIGVLKTRATVTPLNFRFASADIKYAADVTKCKVFIFGDQFNARVEPIMKDMDYCKHYICLGSNIPAGVKSYNEIVEKGDGTPVCVETDDDDMAEFMFTSGTTGAPKPVSHTHKSLFYIGIGNALTYNEGYSSVYLAPHPFYHSGTLFLSFPCYIAAGKVLMPMELQPEYYLRSIADEKCTGGWNTVPTWSDLIAAIKSGQIDLSKYDLSALRHIEIGAQPVPYVLLEDTKKIFPNLPIANIYGITEGGGGGLTNCYDEDIMRKPGSIGKATVFMEAKIVDSEGNELPPGQVGEIVLKGPRLMKEYAFNPEMTAKTIKNGWLYTGDLGYKDEEGFIFFADRSKDLIIRGGENIFPAEIEDVLRKHPKIADVAVLGYPHPRLVEIVMAVIQTKEGETLTDEEVINFVKEKGLAKYKWPEKIIYAPIPRNPAGKIEKPKLRDIYVKPAKEAMEKEFKKQS